MLYEGLFGGHSVRVPSDDIAVTLCSGNRDIANEDGPLGNVGLPTDKPREQKLQNRAPVSRFMVVTCVGGRISLLRA